MANRKHQQRATKNAPQRTKTKPAYKNTRPQKEKAPQSENARKAKRKAAHDLNRERLYFFSYVSAARRKSTMLLLTIPSRHHPLYSETVAPLTFTRYNIIFYSLFFNVRTFNAKTKCQNINKFCYKFFHCSIPWRNAPAILPRCKPFLILHY